MTSRTLRMARGGDTMSTVAEKRMVNSRVDAQALERAKQVLSRQGLTISEFVRYSIEYVSQTNTVPESGAHPIDTADGATDVDAILDWLETQPMPGKADFEGLSTDEMVEQIRREHYGL